MRRSAILLLALLAAGCADNGNEAEPLANDAGDQAERMENMARDIAAEAENRTSAIERALENETQAIFESRNQLLNQAAGNEAEPAEPPANPSR
ncbi:hypothetical protein [Sphingosinicella sp. YJ22]|uniref:hypothetical protein n=1 Tax=Sphingosinicella sp. YJ22 TaxID=1104780 RepID=UPI00140773A1|nr:hypothetical protein [Sphingosinicella sp. YJ22]